MSSGVSIERIVNFPVESNCYIISKVDVDACIVVDPAAGEGLSLKEYFGLKKLKPEYIILTHEHFDHISSVQYLRSEYNCKVIASKKCSDSITSPKKNLSLFYDYKGFECSPADFIIDSVEYKWEWRGVTLGFISTPGHTEGGLCFSIGDNLFTGDTILNEYKLVTKLPGGNKTQLEKSIKTVVGKYNGETNIFPGHGEVFKLSALNLNMIK